MKKGKIKTIELYLCSGCAVVIQFLGKTEPDFSGLRDSGTPIRETEFYKCPGCNHIYERELENGQGEFEDVTEKFKRFPEDAIRQCAPECKGWLPVANLEAWMRDHPIKT